MKRYRLSPGARRDVRQIWTYIAEDNEPAAGRVVREFNEKFEFLGRNPRAGRGRDDIQPGLRSFPFEDYVIFYRVVGPAVRVLRVIHGRRDLSRLFH